MTELTIALTGGRAKAQSFRPPVDATVRQPVGTAGRAILVSGSGECLMYSASLPTFCREEGPDHWGDYVIVVLGDATGHWCALHGIEEMIRIHDDECRVAGDAVRAMRAVAA